MTIRDRLWLWGTRVNTLKEYGFRDSTMTIAGGLREFRLSNAMMCGMLPPTEAEYTAVEGCESILWEMSFDEGFSFERPLAPIVDLHRAHANVRGVLLDDFSTTEISRGAKPELLERMRAALPESMELWIVVYSMNLDMPDLGDYLRHVDGVSFWVWRARELPALADSVARCNNISGGKPLVLGSYLYDFGDGKPLAPEAMVDQLDLGAGLLRKGACQGLCLLASSVMDVGLEAVPAAKEWIEQHGSDRLPPS